EAARILDWLDEMNEFELSALATVHKSQGRTVDTLYVDTATVLKRPSWLSPRDHKRLLYTALTRARKKVVFYSLTGYAQPAGPAKVISFRPAPANPAGGQPQPIAA
ncbi:ATP-binding domain-containing protein, partial [Salipiger bermudensis]|uniref:C-terminal helicase domain-containing protein n=1 Tax=Salipiger bermudensis TaxID=344736 RepID=UPI001C9951BF